MRSPVGRRALASADLGIRPGNLQGGRTVGDGMRSVLVSLATLAVVVAGCATSPSPSSSPPWPLAAASPEVICDTARPQPTPGLTCGPAIAAAAAALAPAHPPIVRTEFRWGGLCPPGAPCAPPLGSDGIVIVDFASGPAVVVYVSAGSGGVVTASSPAPYPWGY